MRPQPLHLFFDKGASLTYVVFGDNICRNEYGIPFKFGPERPGKGARLALCLGAVQAD